MFCARCGQQIPDASEVCPLCGRPAVIELEPLAVSPAPLPAPVTPLAAAVESRPIDPRLKGVHGWLRLFCVIVAVFTPVTMMMTGVDLSLDPWKLINFCFFGFSIAVGASIWFLHRSAIPLLRAYFITLAALGVLGIVGSLQAGQSENYADSFVQPVRMLVFVLIWSAYFMKSERVRANFGRNLF